MNKQETNKMKNSFFSMEEVLSGNEAIWETDEDVANAFSILQLKLPLINKYHKAQKKRE